MKKVIRFVCIAMSLLLLLLIYGCKSEPFTGNFGNSTNCGNIVMCQGKFAYDNGFIYFTDHQRIYEYDTESGITVAIETDVDNVHSMFVSDSYVYYAHNGLTRTRKDGKKTEHIIEIENGCYRLYIEGNYAYYINSVEGSLFHRNIETGETKELINGVLAYFVDDSNIYVAGKSNDVRSLYKAAKDTLKFEKVELSVEPIMVYSDNQSVYLAEKATYQITKLSDGVEEKLPIYSLYYQVVGDNLFYLDEETCQNSCCELKMYNLKTGETKTVYEGVYDFGVLEDRYITIQYSVNAGTEFYLYDIETGETLSMTYED